MEKESIIRNSIQFKVYGNLALFSDPITRVGGEKSSYHLPTYEAMLGICEAIYWKPTIIWIIDKVRVMKPIQTQTKSIKLRKYNSNQNDLATFTYLYDVEYHVSAHFEWNLARQDLSNDRDENKHHNLAKRYLNKGGKRDAYLGTRECFAYIEPCDFDEGIGFYDCIEEIRFGKMFHSFSYPKSENETNLYANLWDAILKRGVISFCKPNECTIKRKVKDYYYTKIEISPKREEYEQEVLNELDNTIKSSL